MLQVHHFSLLNRYDENFRFASAINLKLIIENGLLLNKEQLSPTLLLLSSASSLLPSSTPSSSSTSASVTLSRETRFFQSRRFFSKRNFSCGYLKLKLEPSALSGGDLRRAGLTKVSPIVCIINKLVGGQ